MLSFPQFNDVKYADRSPTNGPMWRASSPTPGALHLDHPRAEVVQDHRGERTGEHAGQIDDGHTGERSGRSDAYPRKLFIAVS